MPLFIRMMIGIVCGFAVGIAFCHMRLRSGLTRDEWIYFKSFLAALRCGEYTVTNEDDERSENNGNCED